MKPSFLGIFQEVNTEDGRGILVSITTPHNGLYVEFDRANSTVWYGTESEEASEREKTIRDNIWIIE
jgi:hypothetical protein